MTTLAEQLPAPPDRGQVTALYLRKAGEALDADFVPGALTPDEERWARRLDEQFASPEWLERVGARRTSGIKIQEDARVGESTAKAPGGLLRATVRIVAGRIDDLTLSGDFTMLPGTAPGEIEARCRGAGLDEAAIGERVAASYRALRVDSPGIQPADVAAVIAAATRAAAG
jgi:hypothetical protein